MKRNEIKVCVPRVGGTNCDFETQLAFKELGARADVVHMNRLLRGDPSISSYDVLVFPGGFAHGDYVRAGAIWAKEMVARIGGELERFVDEGKPILGICNGFQVLVESGLLPGFGGIGQPAEASLATNDSARFECRWVYLRCENRGKCPLVGASPGQVLRMPVAHGEGKFILDKARESLDKLIENDQIAFTYAKPSGERAGGAYPFNPNGSFEDIAGICNPQGNVMGTMPHPERCFYGWQLPDWQKKGLQPYGDGKLLFESILKFVEKRF
ncbi:MAG: phosphoribosylformylglycinamidine synthase subunit PurQ [Candidatus Brockarchaeota archaeon]|nr:phosphoribosylformylglycinamidine synthase subunit PurQ [Candidatus Brockarchaeota archaeon]